MSKKTPTYEDFAVAAEWLDINEGEEGEADSCKKVADWLRDQADAADIRAAARKAGVPAKAVRERMASSK